MRKEMIFLFVILIVLSLILSIGCKKEDNKDDEPPSKPDPATVMDIDGNVYNTIRIGTQLWMVENLKTTRYTDGTVIPTTDPLDQSILSGAYQWITNYDTTLLADFGRAYTLDAATNPAKSICPTGWHIPTLKEWQTLMEYLEDPKAGSCANGGGKLMVPDTTFWEPPSPVFMSCITNESGFTAYGSGVRYGNGTYSRLKTHAYYIVSDYHGPFRLSHANGSWSFAGDLGQNPGVHIRCVMD